MNKLFFYLIIFTFIFLEFADIKLVGNINIKIYELFIPFMGVFLLLHLNKIKRIKTFEVVFIISYFYLAITFFWSINMLLSLKLMVLELMLIITYVYFRIEFSIFSIKELENFILKIGKFYILGSIVLYLIGIYVFNTNPVPGKETYFGLLQENILPRLRGFAESPNSFIPFALFFLIYFMDKREKIWIFITLVTILLSFSTTGMLIAFIVILIYYFNKISFKMIFYSFLVFVVLLLLYINFIQNNKDIMAMIQWRLERNRTGTGRFELWSYALNLIANNIFGYGINTTRVLIHNFRALESVHNSIIEIFLTGGFIGLFLYLLLYTTIFFQSIYIWKKKKEKKMFLLFIVFVLIGMANNTLHIGYVIFYLAILYRYSTYSNIKEKNAKLLSFNNNTII